MASVDDVVASIRSGPSGPKVAAIFDFDGTLIDGYSAQALYAHRAKNFEIGPEELVRTFLAALRGPLDEVGFTDLIERGVHGWAGRTEQELRELGERLFAEEIGGTLFHDAWRLVRAHQNHGHTVVIASSATRLQIAPMADALGIEYVLCTELETTEGVVTGRISGRPLWGGGKSAAVWTFAQRHDIDLDASYAYANGDEDVPFLSIVGQPHAVNPQSGLARHAAEQGWPHIAFATKPGMLDPLPALRTAAMYGSLFATAGAGFVAGLLTNNRRNGMDLATTLFGDIGGWLGDINVVVRGEVHLRSHRPAVFFVNHQSTLIDALVTARLLRRGYTMVMKAEVRDMPVIGQIFDLAGVAFVDRASTAEAIAALQPAVEKLRSGTSIAIAPEGTRSMTPQVGPFKKGGFRLAVDAGVPIVPIVIRNAGEIMWRNAVTAQSGTIEVVVHQPVPTTGWTRSDIDEWLPRTRQLYVDTLDDWPGTHAGHQWSKAIANATEAEA
ncbi:HAD-IB family hydrolase [Nocardia sp. NBC_00565]|uniref:HAD-IB family hydrolase n=1 Tax=Nocardia sp. NBC_00565 TaxID=2975993 RepID=UPI002E80A6A2|nr:HAD-IB family hydrolase [Nocardia sp. NBC_00565]WUC06673.1 HAD-IB family hydrolase [Nocardia sp. NBC_00565]